MVTAAQGPLQSVKMLFLSNLRLFEYNPCDKCKRQAINAAMRQKRLVSRLRNTFEPAVADGMKTAGGFAALPGMQL